MSLLNRLSDLGKSPEDRRYWSAYCAMAGAACIAVAFVTVDILALISGVFFGLLGLKLDRGSR